MIRSLTLGLALLASLAGCATTTHKVEAAVDCGGICKRYQSCFAKDYDVEGCTNTCRRKAAEDIDHRRKADKCMACIDERSCTNATFACATECLSIVP